MTAATSNQTVTLSASVYAGGWRRAASIISLWYRRARTRQHLRALGPDDLADIGLTVQQRSEECGKWFWQGTDEVALMLPRQHARRHVQQPDGRFPAR